MNIAVASSGLGHIARGIESWAADLGRALAARGLSVTLYKGGGQPETPFERVIPCWQRNAAKTARLLRWLPRPLGWRLGCGSGYGIEQTTFAFHLLRSLRRDRVDILHVQDPQLALLVQRARSWGLVSTRIILGHGTEEPLAFQEKITYLQHLAPAHLEEARRAGVWKPTWTAIPNFIDEDVFKPGRDEELRQELGIPSNGFIVLTAAAIKRQHKRIDYLLEEFARWRETAADLPVWLVVAGGWERDTDELVAHGQKLLGERVRFLVKFPRQRMAALYRCADVFVLCSLKEMMPIGLLEAAASGLPCLVNRHPVLEWMIGPGGATIDMAGPGALAGALRTLWGDAAQRRELSQSARRHCVANFGRDRVVDQMLEYYRFVAGHDRLAEVAPAPVASLEPRQGL